MRLNTELLYLFGQKRSNFCSILSTETKTQPPFKTETNPQSQCLLWNFIWYRTSGLPRPQVLGQYSHVHSSARPKLL